MFHAAIALCTWLLLFLSPNVTFGQQSSSNYLKYYQSVAQAEEAVVNKQYHKAVELYTTTLNAYPYNAPVDCYVAAQVASYIADTAACLHFLYKGLSFGLPVPTIKSNPHLADYLHIANTTIVDSCIKKYEQSINRPARATMVALIRRDQHFIKNLPPGENLYENDGRTLKEAYRPLWDSLLQEIVSLTKTVGFPAQKIIGTQNGEDGIFRTGPQTTYAHYIFVHHSNAWHTVKNLLWEELLKGNITPQMYGAVHDNSGGLNDTTTLHSYYASRPCSGCKKTIARYKDAINAQRANIGLCSYETMEKKFESRARYYKWHTSAQQKHPFFDFECDLNFQGI